MVDGAFAEEARAAFGMVPDDAREWAGGAGGDVVRGAEDGDGGDAEGGGDVHGPRVIGEEEAAGGGEVDELAEGSGAGEIARAGDLGGDGLAEVALGRG